MIVLNGLLLLSIPQTLNVWALFGISWLFVLILGSAPVSFIYNGILKLLTFILFKKEKQVQDEGLEEEYDEEDDYEIMRKRKKAIEELQHWRKRQRMPEILRSFRSFRMHWKKRMTVRKSFLMKKIFMWKRTC